MKSKVFLLLIGLLTGSFILTAQPFIVDEVVAVIGSRKVLLSDIESTYVQLISEGNQVNENTKCELLEELMIQKLMANQAELDSLFVTEAEVEGELDMRMRYFISAMGSERLLEEYFGKSVIEIKDDLRADINEQLLTNRMRGKITEGMSVTPSEVRSFYRSIPTDSLPYIDAEVEYNQIVLYPASNDEAIFEVRQNLLDLRQRILNGENFVTLAVIHSEDPGSAIQGGDIGWASRAELDAEYAKAAFALKEGEISRIVESSFGFHIIQCIERTDERVRTRHILMKPKLSNEEKRNTMAQLDSIVQLIRSDSLTFEEAAGRFSEDTESKVNGGQMVNPNTASAKWKLNELATSEYTILNNLERGEISSVYETTDSKGRTVYKVLLLRNRTSPHVANLNDDYNLFKDMALQKKQNEIVNEWIEEKLKTTYFRINDRYNSCNTILKGWWGDI